jgi:hypothetical protein
MFTKYMTERYGYSSWPLEYNLYERFLEKVEAGINWVYNHTVNILIGDTGQKIYVRIDQWDTWSMDCTLAHIIAPMLQQLKDVKHGAPRVDNEDVPESLWANEAEVRNYECEGSTDIHFFARWDWVMDEMIWTFEQKLRDDWDADYYGPWISPEDGQDFGRFEWVDDEGRQKHEARMKNGFRLFGKYYEALWD